MSDRGILLSRTRGARRRAANLALAGLVLLVGGAGCVKHVSRIDPNSVTDLSGRWNDTDSRLVANALIDQNLQNPWAKVYMDQHGGEAPAVIVGSFRNETMEHIPVNTFIGDLERAFINSGMVRLVASPEERQEVRTERQDQQENARADTRARMAQELGARYMLQGQIQSIEDEEGREKVVYYQVDATLIDLESNVKVWAGQHKIKKYIERPRIGW
ncbi:MAG TPA: penicillin-binding protein activator LpoB [Longimicrobiales bacterium]|nr:penicillin-binding protein activator LpoB [Longimicrobiales bacterium]